MYMKCCIPGQDSVTINIKMIFPTSQEVQCLPSVVFPWEAGAPSFGFLLNTLKSRTGPCGFCQSPTEDHEMKSRFLFTSPESLPAGVMEVPCERGSVFHFHAHSNPLCASSGKEAVEKEGCLAHKLSRKGVHQTKSWAGGRRSQSFFLPRTHVQRWT